MSDAQYQPKDILPRGWGARLESSADLEAADAELRGHPHWFAQSMRGWVASLAFDPTAADRHFDRSESMQRHDHRDLALVGIHAVARTENDVLIGREPRPAPRPIFAIRRQFAAGLSTFVRSAIAIEARAELAVGHFDRARERYSYLSESAAPGAGSMSSFGLAVSSYLAGNVDGAVALLEQIGLGIPGAPLFRAARLSARLFAVYDVIGRERDGSFWRNWLLDLPIPETTRYGLLARSERMVSRSVASKRLVLL